MTNYDKLSVFHLGEDLDLLLQRPNALHLGEPQLSQVAAGIRRLGITRDQLIDIAKRKLTEANPLLSHIIGYTADDIHRASGDVRSFNRGATLGLYLIDACSEGGAPIMGIGSAQLAARYRNQPSALEDVRMAADGLLTTQTALSGAFDEALVGMPEGTDRAMARFGAGIITLGAIAAQHFGGTGTEVRLEQD